jgi:hypothetical protein
VDQFDTSTQGACDRDKPKILTLNNMEKAQIGNFSGVLPLMCAAEGHTSQNLQNKRKMYVFKQIFGPMTLASSKSSYTG